MRHLDSISLCESLQHRIGNSVFLFYTSAVLYARLLYLQEVGHFVSFRRVGLGLARRVRVDVSRVGNGAYEVACHMHQVSEAAETR